MRHLFLSIAAFFLMPSLCVYGQALIDVTEQTIKIASNVEEVLYYGFAEGDQIVFSFSEANGKELKEVEILEFPTSFKFSDFKTASIENKVIQVNKAAIYKFRFFNGHVISGRICKVKIQRIPANEQTRNFNTNVNWITRQDTSWNTFTKDIIVGYDTSYVQKTKKEIIKIDTIITELFNKNERVHSATAMGKTAYSYITVNLPENSYSPNKSNPYQSKEVLAWSYWIGVGQKATAEYEKANSSLTDGIAVLGTLTGYGALATLAVSGISMFATPSVGDNVQYKFTKYQNGQPTVFDSGNGISGIGRNDNFLQGGFTIELYNDNIRDGIDVTVKVIAVQLAKVWEDKQYTEQNVTPRLEKKIFNEPIITTTKVPMIGQ
jgi:hypothetical protein